ncbi:MAG: XamI family restriction endonuclease [Candidatus Acidiferrales bacterium]
MKFAPRAFRDTRKNTTEIVEQSLTLTRNLTTITPGVIKANPSTLPTLRMSTCPPLARDRLIGLAGRINAHRRRRNATGHRPSSPTGSVGPLPSRLCATRRRSASLR